MNEQSIMIRSTGKHLFVSRPSSDTDNSSKINGLPCFLSWSERWTNYMMLGPSLFFCSFLVFLFEARLTRRERERERASLAIIVSHLLSLVKFGEECPPFPCRQIYVVRSRSSLFVSRVLFFFPCVFDMRAS